MVSNFYFKYDTADEGVANTTVPKRLLTPLTWVNPDIFPARPPFIEQLCCEFGRRPDLSNVARAERLAVMEDLTSLEPNRHPIPLFIHRRQIRTLAPSLQLFLDRGEQSDNDVLYQRTVTHAPTPSHGLPPKPAFTLHHATLGRFSSTASRQPYALSTSSWNQTYRPTAIASPVLATPKASIAEGRLRCFARFENDLARPAATVATCNIGHANHWWRHFLDERGADLSMNKWLPELTLACLHHLRFDNAVVRDHLCASEQPILPEMERKCDGASVSNEWRSLYVVSSFRHL
jgi:hypothetical protein